MNGISIKPTLNTMQNMALQAQGKAQSTAVDGAGKFADVLMKQLDHVNSAQHKSEELQNKFALGDPNVSLVQVKTAELKAMVLTQGLIQIRNDVVEAYKNVMNMPI